MPTHIDGIEQSPCTARRSPTRWRMPRHPSATPSSTSRRSATGRWYKDGWWLAMKTERIPWSSRRRRWSRTTWRLGSIRTRRALLPAGRLHPGEGSRRRQPREGEGAGELFWAEAEKYKVLPLLSTLAPFFDRAPAARDRQARVRGDVQNVLSMIPRIYNHSYAISAELVILRAAPRVIVAEADHLGGFLAVRRRRHADAHLLDDGRIRLPSAGRGGTPEGDDGADGVRRRRGEAGHGGEVTLFIDDRPVGRADGSHGADPLPATPEWTSAATTGCGRPGVRDGGSRPFTGTIKKVVFDVNPHGSTDEEHQPTRRSTTAMRRTRSRREPGSPGRGCNEAA